MCTYDDQELLDSFPVFSAEDISRVNALFEPYVFYSTAKDGGRDCECTSCNGRFHVEGLPRMMTPEWREFMDAKHNSSVRCPECGRKATLKNRGICKTGKNLEEWCRVILFHENGGAVYGQAYYVRKRYSPENWRPDVEYLPKAVYLLRPGEAIGWRWEHDYTGLGMRRSGMPLREKWTRMKTPCEPWTAIGYCGFGGCFQNGYHLVGLERLQGSFLRYCAVAYLSWTGLKFGDGKVHYDAMKFFSAAAFHPRIEVLLKMGLRNLTNDLVISKRKLSRDIKWKEQDPRKAFGLTWPELKEFCAIDGTAAQLRRYKRFRKAGLAVTFQEIQEAERGVPGDLSERFFRACLAGRGVRPMKALDYIRKRNRTALMSRDTIIQWLDYVEAAKYCGYDLDNPLVLMPKRLKTAHDGAVETELRLRYENETADDSDYQRRYQRLMERYGFEDEAFFIRAPSSSREIIQEGKVLGHCVGRYAGKHASGQTTILFMRRTKNPFLPAWTIEVKGDSVVQVQGKGNMAENGPREEAQAFLKRWKAWVKAGSRRDKDGRPVIPKNGKETAA